MKIKSGFTLAEVLITLSIIGVVAAITLPVILNKIEKQVNINKLKREYALYQQAFQQIAEKNGLEFRNGISHCDASLGDQHTCLKDVFKAELKTIADCDLNSGANLSRCFVAVNDAKMLNGEQAKDYYFNRNTTAGLVLEDGSSAAISIDSANCDVIKNDGENRCAFIIIDVNGPKRKPNTWGKDLFLFFIRPNKIVPANKANTDGALYRDDCETGTNYGMTCAGKFLYK